MSDPEIPTPAPPPEPEAAPPPSGRRLPSWLAYGGTALVVLLLAAYLVGKFVLPPPPPVTPPSGPGKITATTPPPSVTTPPPVTTTTPPGTITPPPVAVPPPPGVTAPPKTGTPTIKPAVDVAAIEAAMKKAQELMEQKRWDEADALLEKTALEHTDPDGRISRVRTDLKAIREKQKQLFETAVGQAIALLEKGKPLEGIAHAMATGRLYPEMGAKVLPTFKEKVRTSLRDAPMVMIAGRTFTAGTSEDPRFPVREATVATFFIESTEVTVERYAVFCMMTSRPVPPGWGPDLPRDRLNHPVSMVTLEDARAYAAWIERRLPTADEWELAARYIDQRHFPWGASFQISAEEPFRANTLENTVRNNKPDTTAVGAFPAGASPHGVMDLIGNVWEWTETPAKTRDGEDGFILKGGSFFLMSKMCRAALGFVDVPDQPHVDVGFRCVRTAPE